MSFAPVRKSVLLFSFLLLLEGVHGQWAKLDNLEVKREVTELAGPCVVFSYDLEEASANSPVHVFVRYRVEEEGTWARLSPGVLTGDGVGLVNSPGRKEIFWWGTEELGLDRPESMEYRIRGVPLCRIPAGKFTMKSVPGQGRDELRSHSPSTELPEYFLAKNETTVQMYADFLNEVGFDGAGWNERMSNPERCGIERLGDGSFRPIPGRENHPVTYVSWYDSLHFARWCGLRLPSEAEFEKAIRGGVYLDGDEQGKVVNPSPERRFPWGDEAFFAGGKVRANCDGSEDGFEMTAPVGSFSDFLSPYGIADLIGNVAEWTRDWYTTSYHAGLDGFRVVRGGSWMDTEEACDAISGATQFPLDETSIIGFRVARSGDE